MSNWIRRLLVALSSAAGIGAAQAKELSIYICADMEGIAGVVSQEQLGPPGFEYERFREFMTGEVNAAIEGATAAGATRIVVSDSHGNAQSLLIEKFPDTVRVLRSFPRPLDMYRPERRWPSLATPRGSIEALCSACRRRFCHCSEVL